MFQGEVENNINLQKAVTFQEIVKRTPPNRYILSGVQLPNAFHPDVASAMAKTYEDIQVPPVRRWLRRQRGLNESPETFYRGVILSDLLYAAIFANGQIISYGQSYGTLVHVSQEFASNYAEIKQRDFRRQEQKYLERIGIPIPQHEDFKTYREILASPIVIQVHETKIKNLGYGEGTLGFLAKPTIRIDDLSRQSLQRIKKVFGIDLVSIAHKNKLR